MELVLQYLPGVMLVFCRITSFFVVAPVFSAHNVPVQWKLGFAFFVSFITFVSIGTQTPIAMDYMFILSIVREVAVGLCLGFIAYMYFTVVQIAGSFIDIQAGFGIANVIDPLTGAQSPLIGNLKYMIAMLLFLSFNGHHYLLEGIMRSYEWIPLNNTLFERMYQGQISDFMLKSFSAVFSLSFQLAMPLVVALFLTDLGLGLLARVAPQFNIFVIGIPIKIIIAFVMLALLFPAFELFFKNSFSDALESMKQFFGLFKS